MFKRSKKKKIEISSKYLLNKYLLFGMFVGIQKSHLPMLKSKDKSWFVKSIKSQPMLKFENFQQVISRERIFNKKKSLIILNFEARLNKYSVYLFNVYYF